MSAPASEMAANPCATGHFGECTIPCRDPHLVLCKPGRLCYTLPAREHLFRLFLGSSAVEHSTVNRMVAGSNPARGAISDAPRLIFLYETRRRRPDSQRNQKTLRSACTTVTTGFGGSLNCSCGVSPALRTPPTTWSR